MLNSVFITICLPQMSSTTVFGQVSEGGLAGARQPNPVFDPICTWVAPSKGNPRPKATPKPLLINNEALMNQLNGILAKQTYPKCNHLSQGP